MRDVRIPARMPVSYHTAPPTQLYFRRSNAISSVKLTKSESRCGGPFVNGPTGRGTLVFYSKCSGNHA